MNKIRKEKESERVWKQKQRKLSRDYCNRMGRLKREQQQHQSEMVEKTQESQTEKG